MFTISLPFIFCLRLEEGDSHFFLFAFSKYPDTFSFLCNSELDAPPPRYLYFVYPTLSARSMDPTSLRTTRNPVPLLRHLFAKLALSRPTQTPSLFSSFQITFALCLFCPCSYPRPLRRLKFFISPPHFSSPLSCAVYFTLNSGTVLGPSCLPSVSQADPLCGAFTCLRSDFSP